ncbi:DUF3618 domain-containing protein [Kitasatospora terrestris]|uniref:DUF3618 domain-containing protein n=1 Tax=Kitasatospora terrestris TaxID=258051 RepID=A0ABP9DEK5_9ACTN
MGATPDELRGEVEARRAHLAHNVDRLADRITPSRVAHRQADAARQKMTGIKERVMGTAHDTNASAQHAAAAVGDTAGHLTDTAKDTAGQIGGAIQQTPAKLRRQTQGSPLGAGIMAFGAGLLAAALIPTSRPEQRAGAMLREHQEVLEPVKEAAVDAVREVRNELREPAADALEAVKSTAQEAADTTKGAAQDAGRRTAEELKETGQETAAEIRQAHP